MFALALLYRSVIILPFSRFKVSFWNFAVVKVAEQRVLERSEIPFTWRVLVGHYSIVVEFCWWLSILNTSDIELSRMYQGAFTEIMSIEVLPSSTWNRF